MISDSIINQYSVSSELEFPHKIADVPGWTEYHYFGAFDQVRNVAFSIHIGRLPADPEIWRGILYVLLPDGDVLAHKCAGRDGHAAGPGAAGFKASCIEPFRRWKLEFDGALQRTTLDDLATGILKDNIDEVVRFTLDLEAGAPLHSIEAHATEGASWRHHHHEQLMFMRGELTVNGSTLQLEGVAGRDHSSGPRDYTSTLGGFWAHMLFPGSGRAVQALVVTRKGAADSTHGFFAVNEKKKGYIYWGDDTPIEEVEILAHPKVSDAETPNESLIPNVLKDEGLRTFDLVLSTSRGNQTLQAERLRAIASTYLSPCAEIAGTAMDRLDAFQQTKTFMQVKWGDEIGYGMSDNYTRIECLKRG